MNILSSSATVNASLESTWAKLMNWQEWTRWDGGMETIKFDGTVEKGAHGRLKLVGGPTVDLVLTELQFGQSYKSEFTLFGTRYMFDHVVATNGAQTNVRVDVEADGPTSFLFGALMKAKLKTALPQWVEKFKEQLEQESPGKERLVQDKGLQE